MDALEKSQFTLAALPQVLSQKSQEIQQKWLAALKRKWDDRAEAKLLFLTADQRRHQDLFTLIKHLLGHERVSVADIEPLLNRIGMGEEAYSLLDFCQEVDCLQAALESVLRSSPEIAASELPRMLGTLGQKLDAVRETVLQSNADLYRSVIGQGARGYCLVDAEGRIIYANQKMKKWLKSAEINGLPLEEFFEGEEREFIKQAYAQTLQKAAGPRPLTLRSGDGKIRLPVGVEVGPLTLGGQRQGGYACLVDLSLPLKMQEEIYNRSPVGIVQTNLQKMITFANRRFLEKLLKGETWEGLSLWDLFPDEENQAIVKAELMKRQEGESGEYEVELTQRDGRRIPVKIYSVAVTDLNGKFTGSLAIIRSLEREKNLAEREKALAAITPHLATIHHWPDMLNKIARELARFIPYHYFSVAEISADRQHIRRLHTYLTENEKIEWETRWLPVSDQLVDWLQEQRKPYIIDNLETFFAQRNWREKEKLADIQKIIENFRACLIYPVEKGGEVKASINLFHREEGVYREKDRELLEVLPLDKAVLMALDIEENEKNQFHFDLIQDISSACNDFNQVAKIIVNRLADQYKWSNVSLFQADEEFGLLRLLDQKAGTGDRRFPEDYQQPLHEGILGYVFEKKEDVIVGDFQEDPKFKDIVKIIWEDIHSEICLPIVTAEGCWLLNIEDTKKYAFSPEELKTLKDFRDEVGKFLEHSWLYYSLKATLDASSDAIISTDWRGIIKTVNPATAELLRYPEKEMEGKSLGGYFQNAKLGEETVMSRFFRSEETVWQTKGGEPLKVLLSAAPLPEPFRGKIFIAKNLEYQKKAEKLGQLEEVCREIATQIKTPLSLMFGWLGQLKEKAPGPQADTLDRIIRQLHRIYLTCDRLSLFDYDEKKGWVPFHAVLLNSGEIVNKVMDMFPKSEQKKIDLHYKPPLPYVQGDLFQLVFCLQTILSYLLRVVPEGEKINLTIYRQDERLAMEITGSFPGSQEFEASRTWAAMALGEEAIRKFIANHQGTYSDPVREGEKMTFRLALPIARGE